MFRIIDFAAGFLSLLPFYIILQLHSRKLQNDCGIKVTRPHVVGVFLFGLLLVIMLSVTGVPPIYDLKFDYASVSLIPFADIFSENSARAVLQYILNILLFVPFGIAVPVLWKDYSRKLRTPIMGFLLSLTIELLQLMSFRTCDIDDLIANTLGTFIGYLIFMLVKRYLPSVIDAFQASGKYGSKLKRFWQREGILCIAIAFATYMIIQPLLTR